MTLEKMVEQAVEIQAEIDEQRRIADAAEEKERHDLLRRELAEDIRRIGADEWLDMGTMEYSENGMGLILNFRKQYRVNLHLVESEWVVCLIDELKRRSDVARVMDMDDSTRHKILLAIAYLYEKVGHE